MAGAVRIGASGGGSAGAAVELPRELDLGAFGEASYERWRALVEADLKGAPFEKRLVTHTYEGLHVQPLYTARDMPASAVGQRSGMGSMARAARVLGNARGGWEIRQERAEASVERANAALREDLEGGASAVVVRLDACARAGLDPRDGQGLLLCGRDGVAAYDLADFERVFEGVHLEMIGVSLEAGGAFVEGAALLAALWERRGVGVSAARGRFQADPLAVLARDGHLGYSVEEGLGRLGALAAWTGGRYAQVRSVRVGTAAYHHGGATATQDLAFAMATGLEYLRAMERAGLTIARATGQIEFSFAVGCGTFLAVAKLRAARRLWARVVEACGGDEDARRLVMFVRASKRVMTTRDPWVNILRNAACVFAGGLAGADAIGGAAFDGPLGEPSALGRRVARNTHHVLMEECELHRVCDPAGGSWYVERLTEDLCEGAWTILRAIEARGGMAKALAEGWIGSQIDAAMQPRARNLATRKDVVVGVSDFPSLDDHLDGASRADLARVVTDHAALGSASRARLDARARGDRGEAIGWRGGGWSESAMGEVVRRAMDGATIGDLARSLRGGDAARGGATIPAAVQVHPYAEAFEAVRDAADAYAAQCGHRARVYLAALGGASQRLARVNFCRNLFEAGGFEVVGGGGDGSVEAAAGAMAGEGPVAEIAVICGPDERYAADVSRLAPALRAGGARCVVLAGNPGASEAAYRAAGVDRFVFVKCDVVGLLRELMRVAGGGTVDGGAA